MFKKQLNRFALVAALVTTLGLMAPTIGLAAGPTGTGPNDAMAPTGTIEHLNAGQSRWYVFHSAGKDKNGDPSHVLITLFAQPDGSAGFNVWTKERLAEHLTAANPDKDAPPVGEGTKLQLNSADNPNPKYLFNGALIWAEGFVFPSTYLVEVYTTGSQASDYTLTITGDAVTFPTSVTTSQRDQASTPAMQAALAGMPSGGTGPDNALAPSPDWQHLNVGQSRWYAFSSAGKDKNGDPSHVLITLFAQPDGSAGFNVWTKERLAEHAVADNPDKDAPPIGEGTKLQFSSPDNPNTKYGFNGALIWAGGINEAGTYFVEVYQTGTQASDYQLSITGDALSFPGSVTTTTSQPGQATIPAMQAAAAGVPSGGTGPNNALAPSGNWQHLNVGQRRWYAFYSAGEDKNGDPSHVLVTLFAQPDGSAGFNVWTVERLAEHAVADNPDKDAPPIGEGTKLVLKGGDDPRFGFNGALIWAGGLNEAGKYLVEVYQTGSQASDYQLSIAGDAVSFP
jgi:hypothetical protein